MNKYDKCSTILSWNELLPAMSQKYRIGPVGSKRSKHSILGKVETCITFNSLCNQIGDSVVITSQRPKTSNDHKRPFFMHFSFQIQKRIPKTNSRKCVCQRPWQTFATCRFWYAVTENPPASGCQKFRALVPTNLSSNSNSI